MRKLALLSALLAVPLMPMAANAEIVNLHLFPLSHPETTVIEQPAVIEQAAPMVQTNTMTMPAVIEPTATTTTTTVTTPAMPLTDMQIRTPLPTGAQRTSTIQTTTTLPAVIEPGIGTTTVQTNTFSALIPPISVGEPVLGLNAMDRLHDMMDQVSLGVQRGMLTSDQQTAFTSEHDRIAGMINSLSADGLTIDEVNQIETQLNLLNQSISNGMSI